MLTLDQHFASGYLPSLTGGYFNLVLLLSQYSGAPNEDLRAAVQEEIARLRVTGEGVKDNVRLVQALAELVGFAPPAPPRTPDAYFEWFSAVYAGFRAGITLHNRGEIVHVVAHGLGEMVCSWNVALLVLKLLAADPENPALEQQWAALQEDLRRARDATRIHARHPNAPLALTALAEEFSVAIDAILEEDPPPDAEGLQTLGRQLDNTLRAFAAGVAQARAQLRDEETAGEA
jgi:hypothetical protein